jgi:hypothetical protein
VCQYYKSFIGTAAFKHEEHVLPCSVGRADVRITDACIFTEGGKKAEQKASA